MAGFPYNPWVIFTPLPPWSFSYTLTPWKKHFAHNSWTILPRPIFFLTSTASAAIDKHDLYAWLASFLILGNRVCGVGIVLELNNLGHTVSQSVEKQRQVFG